MYDRAFLRVDRTNICIPPKLGKSSEMATKIRFPCCFQLLSPNCPNDQFFCLCLLKNLCAAIPASLKRFDSPFWQLQPWPSGNCHNCAKRKTHWSKELNHSSFCHVNLTLIFLIFLAFSRNNTAASHPKALQILASSKYLFILGNSLCSTPLFSSSCLQWRCLQAVDHYMMLCSPFQRLL